jgi:hypothetical protein
MSEFEPVLETKISSLIESQLPAHFREEGPIFVAFVKEYYKWLEGSQTVANTQFVPSGWLNINAGQANVSGRGTNFESFANGDTIAIYHQDNRNDYELYTINAISNNSFMVLNEQPQFSSVNSAYSTVKLEYNPNYYLRRYMDNKDIDTTTNDFLVYFKEKYLKNIQFTTKSNLKTLLKHSLDLYRSKGTERAIDLLFRSVFGQPASVYYPGDDIFRLSDGKWYQPTYLEISIRKDSDKLVGKQIVGAISGATAFAESLVRRTVKNRIIDILYISAVNGDFEVDEPINSTDTILEVAERPFVIGSLTEAIVDINGSGSNYVVGDTVDLYSDHGEQGKARVTSVTDATGLVTFTLENGGYGYSNTANVLISEKILVVSNVVVHTTNPGYNYLEFFDYVSQPLANIAYSAGTGQFANGDMVYTWATGVVNGTGKVIRSEPTSTTNGSLLISVISGNLNHTTLYSTGNTFAITKQTYANATAVANVIGYYSNVVLTVSQKSGNFQNDEEIYQLSNAGVKIANGSLTSYAAETATTGTVRLTNVAGVFVTNKTLYGETSNASANVQTQRLYVGVIDTVNAFYSDSGNYVTFANSLTNGTITSISSGALANVDFSNNMIYTETVDIGADLIADYLNIRINATTYGFPQMPTGNLTVGTLAQQLTNVESYMIGKIYQLTGINRGSGYNLGPIVKIYDPLVARRYIHDNELMITGTTRPFTIGELVSQDTAGINSRGIVKEANDTHMFVERLRFNDANAFVTTTNTATKITGETSGAVANVTTVYVDYTSGYLGLNANLVAEAKTVEGAVTGLAIVDSGFGYQKSDSLRFAKPGVASDDENAGLAFANLLHQGYGEGYYKRKGGWLSDQAKLYDGWYYQEYSYEIRASITLNKYEDMLKQLLHVAGTKYFGAFVYPTQLQINTSFQNAVITSGS